MTIADIGDTKLSWDSVAEASNVGNPLVHHNFPHQHFTILLVELLTMFRH
jgi:hypothetical protein